MPLIRRLTLLGLLASATTAGLAAPASAAPPPTVITFDTLAAAPTVNVDDQYASVGVEFGHPHRWGIDFGVTEGCGGTGSNLGAQYVTGGGITGQSLSVSCAGRPSGLDSTDDLGYAVGWRFATERHDVSFKMRANANPSFAGNDNSGVQLQPGPFAVKVRYFRAEGTLIVAQDFTLAKGAAATSVSLSRGAVQEIGYVVITAPKGSLQIDDINAPNDDVPPPRKFTLALSSPTLDVTEGDTSSTSLKAVRFNGSTGPVGLVVSPLPSGIVAAVPDPIGGTAAATLRVTAAAPATGDRQITVTSASGAPGAEGAFVGTPLTLTARISTALFLDRTTLSAAPGCAGAGQRVAAVVRGNYSGLVTMTITKSGGPATLSPTVAVVGAVGNGTIVFPVTASSPPTNSPSTYTVTLTPAGATPVSGGLAVYAGAADSVSIDAVDTPTIYHSTNVGSRRFQAIIRGNFPSTCPVTFKDDVGNDLPRVVGSVSREAGQSEGLRLDLGLDPVATSIHAVAASGKELAKTKKIGVSDFRNTSAPWQVNGGAGAGVGAFSWNDFVRAFGQDDTDSCFDAYCWRDSTAVKYYNRAVAGLTARNGLCFGWSSQSVSFFTQTELPSEFSKGAGTGYTIPSYADSTPAKQNVATWQARYQDRSNLIEYGRQAATPLTVTGLRQRITDRLSHNRPPLVDVWQSALGTKSNAGHSVVAIDTRSTPDGGYDIITYNPNFPYTPSEELVASTRTNTLTSSIIHVTPAGIWSGGISGWTGPLGQLQLLDLPSLNATLPIDLPSVASSGEPGVAEIAQITIDGKEALQPGGSVIAGRGVLDDSLPTGGKVLPSYRLLGGGNAQLEIVGKKIGTYASDLLGGSVAAGVAGARTAPGQHDILLVKPNESRLAFTSDGGAAPVTLSLDAKLAPRGAAEAARPSRNRITRSATVKLMAGGDRSDTLSLGGALALDHVGASTSAAITLVSTGLGLPQSATFAPIPVGADQKLALQPDTWTDLTTGARFTVRNAAGRVVRKGRARAQTPKSIRLASGLTVTTKRLKNGRNIVSVSGRVIKRGAAPELVARVRILRGGKVVKTAVGTLRGIRKVKAGRFTIPITVSKLAAGTRAKVDVTLIDEAASLASTTVRSAARLG